MSVSAPPFASMFARTDTVGKPSSLLLYGPAGTRKTTIAGGIVGAKGFEKARVLYLDIDQGRNVLASDVATRAAMDEGRFDIVPINKLDSEAFGMLKYFLGDHNEDGVFQRGEAFKYGYDVVILDSLDVAQEVAADWYLANTFSENGKPNTMKAWGEISRWTRDVAWAFQTDPDALGIIVMHSTEGTEDTGAFKIKPKLSGSAKDSISSIPDLVAYLGFEANPEDKKDIRLVATVGASDVTLTKHRWRGLPDKIVDFDLVQFFDLIQPKTTKPAAVQAA